MRTQRFVATTATSKDFTDKSDHMGLLSRSGVRVKDSLNKMSADAPMRAPIRHFYERRGVIRRLAPAWLTRLPPDLPRSDAKVYNVRLALPFLGAGLHLALVFLYLAIGVPMMALVNFISVAIFVIAATMVWKGRHYAGTILATVEVCVHVPVVTYLLGTHSGYLTYNFILAAASALTFPKSQTKERIVIVAYAFISSHAMTALMSGIKPAMPLLRWQNDIVFYIIASTTFLALVGISYHFASITERAEARVHLELQRSESLLLNVLPAPIADRLKIKPGTIADSFENTTVLFADIVGFTPLASLRPGPEIVEMLNEIFSIFDRIAARYGLEKIKTIGDAYLVAGGVPVPRPDHAVAVTAMAIEMVSMLRQSANLQIAALDLRVGIHSGSVVAGVIGEKKFAYDLWGDTVNVASRMESLGLAGRIQISEATRILLDDSFELEERGLVEVKGKGAMKTWFVLGRKNSALPRAG